MSKNTNKFLLFIILLFFLFSSLQANLQTGKLQGHVVDEDKNPINRAIIYLDSPEVSSLLFSITPATGNFQFFSLPPGKYTATVEIPEFKRTIIQNIVIEAGKTIQIEIPLKKIVLPDIAIQGV